MNSREFAAMMLSMLPFEPNEQQMAVGLALARFCAREDNSYTADRVFILNGYAGPGKTTLIGALVKALRRCRIDTVLMAPPGRAAKVFTAGAAMQASTIHRRIYRHSLTGGGRPVPQENKHTDAIFIVDEASMIAADSSDGSSLLTDLIHYIYSSPGCRLILLGDTAQLPPVGQAESPAMSSDTLRGYGLKVTRATMTAVARQGADSGILFNATRIRRTGECRTADPDRPLRLATAPFADVRTVSGEELPELLEQLYAAAGIEDTVVITRSNLTATQFNQAIRQIVMGREELLTKGDLMIAAKNNYYWTRKTKGIDFVANGEMMRLKAIHSSETRYGLHFADVTFEIPDTPGVEFDAKIIVTCLTGSAAALDGEGMRRLYEGVYNDPALMPPGAPHDTRVRLMRESPYWNAIQVKYAYAVTCHKAQGGQWSNVLVDLSYIPPEQVGSEFCRWLYTAVTRARKCLYLINPPDALLDTPSEQ